MLAATTALLEKTEQVAARPMPRWLVVRWAKQRTEHHESVLAVAEPVAGHRFQD